MACISGSTTRSIKCKTSLSGALVLSALWGLALNKREQFYNVTWEPGDGDVIPELICHVWQLGFHPSLSFCLQKLGKIFIPSFRFKRKRPRHIIIQSWVLLHLNLGRMSLCPWRWYFVASLVRCLQCFICDVYIVFHWDPIIFPWNLLNPQLLNWQKIGLNKPTVTDLIESTLEYSNDAKIYLWSWRECVQALFHKETLCMPFSSRVCLLCLQYLQEWSGMYRVCIPADTLSESVALCLLSSCFVLLDLHCKRDLFIHSIFLGLLGTLRPNTAPDWSLALQCTGSTSM